MSYYSRETVSGFEKFQNKIQSDGHRKLVASLSGCEDVKAEARHTAFKKAMSVKEASKLIDKANRTAQELKDRFAEDYGPF